MSFFSPPKFASPKPTRPTLAAVSETIQRALASAGLDADSGVMKGVNETIRKALASAGIAHAPPAGPVIDVEARVITPTAPEVATVPTARTARTALDTEADTEADTERATASDTGADAPRRPASAEPAATGRFIALSYANAAGTRAYKLYVPSRPGSEPMPLIVMLHGCTQNPDDFAAGTRMNEWAERHGFLVAYPAQSANANGSNCWNWFRSQDQARDAGEPSLIAGITREIASAYPVDEERIFVAGLSAGAAMAVILGATYPDLYAGVGAHSGLPFGAARDMPSAFAAMQGGASAPSAPGFGAVPTIVFHGDRDSTVNAANGRAIVESAVRANGAREPLTKTARPRSSAAGRDHSTTVFHDARGRARVEEWVLHGAGHAWSGGAPRGSYTDPGGPDASAEMVRFFLDHRRGQG